MACQINQSLTDVSIHATQKEQQMNTQKETRRIIVAVAPVGRNIEPPSRNPITPEAVAREVITCTRAGASMVHLHVRDQKGNQTANLKDFSETLDLIRRSSDIIIQGSTGGLSTLSLEQRCVALDDPRVETASLNMGSVNFDETVYVNTLPDIRHWAHRMAAANVAPELEIFEAGMLPAARKLIAENTIKAPFSVNLCLGARWALPADPHSLCFMQSMLIENAPWGVIHDGMTDLSLLAVAIGMGAAAVRVGFEDSVFFAPGKIADNNVKLVAAIVGLIRQIGFEVATPGEAREILGLKR
jgi:3-keto-5-aminohexanoate cleavage enzyme